MSSSKYIPPHKRKQQQQVLSGEGGVSSSSSSSISNKTNSDNNNSTNKNYPSRNSNVPSTRFTQLESQPSPRFAAAATSLQQRGGRFDNWHRSSSNSNDNRKRIIFFGDSFVRLFGLLEHRDITVRGFKGASAKGLCRDGNPNRMTILRQVTPQHPGATPPDRVLLSFGNVDVHMSYYYTKYVKKADGDDDKPAPAVIDLPAVARAYVEFAASLPVKHVHIIACYPSPLEEEYVCPSLECYGAITAGTEVSPDDITIASRQGRVQEFNRALQESCEKHGLYYEDAFTDLVDLDTLRVKESFQDVSAYNIHLVWETTILMWLEKWPWLRPYVKPGFRDKIQKTLDEYLKTKEWAGKEHVAANIGVGEAFDMSRTET